MVLRRQHLADQVASSVTVLAAEVSRALDEQLAPFLSEGQTLPDFTVFQEMLSGCLQGQSADLLRADEAHFRALRADRRSRQQRDQAVTQMATVLRRVKSEIDRSYGVDQSDALVGLGRVPRLPVELWRLGRSVLALLQVPDQVWPSALPEAEEPQLGLLVGEVEAALVDLDSALSQLQPARRRAQLTRGARKRLIERFDRVSRRCVRLLKSLYEVAGFPFDAERILGTVSRSRRQQRRRQAGRRVRGSRRRRRRAHRRRALPGAADGGRF